MRLVKLFQRKNVWLWCDRVAESLRGATDVTVEDVSVRGQGKWHSTREQGSFSGSCLRGLRENKHICATTIEGGSEDKTR